jgi:hypothetical protein
MARRVRRDGDRRRAARPADSALEAASAAMRVAERVTVTPGEAAQLLGVSRDFFDEHVKPGSGLCAAAG